MAHQQTLAYIVGLYLTKSNKQGELVYALAKDWHQYMDMNMRWRYAVRGCALELVEIQTGVIPQELL